MSIPPTKRRYIHPLSIIPHRPDDAPLVCLPVNVYWVAFLLFAIDSSKYPEAWLGTLEENQQARNDVRRLIEMLIMIEDCEDFAMTPQDCCVEVQILVRINVDTGRIEQSRDGGTTWEGSPKDPITQIIEPPPPVTSGVSVNKCDAATNGRQHFEDWVAHVSDAFDVALGVVEFITIVAAAIANALLILITGGAITAFEALLLELIGGVCAAVWEAGKTVWDEYWISDNLDVVLCSFYCNMLDDGSFDDAAYSKAMTYLKSNLPASVAKSLAIGMFTSIGRQGINKWCSYGAAADSDCSDCGCLDCMETWSPRIVDGTPLAIINSVVGNEMLGTAVYAPTLSAPPYIFAIQTTGDDDCCTIKEVYINDAPVGIVYHIPCGQPRSMAFPYPTTVIPSGSPGSNTVQLLDSIPFTVRIVFAGATVD